MKTKKKRKAAKKPKSFKPKQELQDKLYDKLAETTGESKPTTTFIEYHRRAYGQ